MSAAQRRLMTPNEVSDYLAVPVGTLYQWRHRGDGPPAYRVGRHLRYDEADLVEWLRQQRDPEGAR